MTSTGQGNVNQAQAIGNQAWIIILLDDPPPSLFPHLQLLICRVGFEDRRSLEDSLSPQGGQAGQRVCPAWYLSYKQSPPFTLVHCASLNSSYRVPKNPKVRKYSNGLCSSFQAYHFGSEAVPSFILSSLDKDKKDTLLSIQDLLEEGVGLFSITFSFKDREKRGDYRRERKQKVCQGLPVS